MPSALDFAVPLVARFEGFRSRVYLDPVGVPTIGYGETDRKVIDYYRSGISEPQARALLRKRLGEFMHAVAGATTVPLAPQQLAALTSFAYNVGTGAYRSSTLLRKLKAGDYAAVPHELMRWTLAGGRRFEGLVIRRRAEGKLYRSWVHDLSPLSDWERSTLRELLRLRSKHEKPARQHELAAALVKRRKQLYVAGKREGWSKRRRWLRWRLLVAYTT